MAGAVVEPEREACQCGHSHHDAPESVVDARSLAEQLWMPWRAVVLNPVSTAVAYLVFNALFISTWLLVSLLVWLLTLPGLLLIIASSVFFGLRRVVHFVSYPGQLSLVVRDGESNFARLTKRRLTMALDAAQEVAQTLSEGDTSASGSNSKRTRYLQQQQNFEFSMDTLVMPLLRALERVDNDGGLGVNGSKLLAVLKDFSRFASQDWSKCTAELTSASIKDFEQRRQQLFLAAPKIDPSTSNPAKPTQLLPPSSQQQHRVPSRLIVELDEKIARVRETMSLIGPPSSSANTKRDLSWIAHELCRQKPSDVDIITNLHLIRADLAVRFHGEQVWIPSDDNHQIDAMFVPAAGGFSVDKPVMILCNPNGGLYEFHHFQMDWVKFYTELECHLMLFNYRGYGRNAGTPSPWAHNLDALAIIDYLRVRKGVKKIGVHGESIGGLVATFLAQKSDSIDVLIADRTFANLPALAQRLVASWAGRAVNWLTWWETDNAGNYLAARCPKLLCSDPNDEIILDGASLKSGVALRVELGDQHVDIPQPVPLGDIEDTRGESERPAWFNFRISRPKCSKLLGGDVLPRRLSESDTRPQVGIPLTEAIIRRFSEASLSLGRRAMKYAEQRESAIARTISGSNSPAGSIVSSSHVEISVREGTPRSPSFPQELLAVVWMQLASLDGYCGHCFLQAAESGGYDRIRAWTVSMLTWGGQLTAPKRNELTLPAFDRQGLLIRPLTIFQVHKTLQAVTEQHPSVKFDLDIGVVLQMIEFIMDSLQHRWKMLDEQSAETNVRSGPDPRAVYASRNNLGRLLPLHCGHNRQFADNEKAELIKFLRDAGFLTN